MSNSRLVLAAIATVIAAACAPEPPPEAPAPTGPTAEELAAAEQARLDSIAAVEEAERMAAEREALRLEAERAAAEMRRILMDMVYFDYDEAVIRPDAEETLRAKLEILRDNPGMQLRMEGHADERGTSEYNIALGNERAEAVIQFLTGFGLDAGRFSSVSYGEEMPQAQGSSEEAWARNRRVEFVITAGGGDFDR